MTSSGDFFSLDTDRTTVSETVATYPTAFGLTLTPRVQVIALLLLGLAGAYGLYNLLVQPVQLEKEKLEAQVNQKQAQIDQQKTNLKNLPELQANLAQAMEQRVGIYSLLGKGKSLDTLLLDINQQIQSSNSAIAGVLRANPQSLKPAQLAALGLSPAQVERIRTQLSRNPGSQKSLYISELTGFSPKDPVPYTEGPPELANKLQRQTVEVSMRALFPQTLNILRNLERLEPLIIIRDVKQELAPLPGGGQEQQLQGIIRRLNTSFTLEVLVPAIDPGKPPAPKPAAKEQGGVPPAP
ncbi:MAG: hypothetical protein ACKO5P_09395 [Nodosilinea sp.]